MRFRLMATYRGVPYEVGVGPSSSDVVLFAACPPPGELGYWQVDRGVYELVTPRDEVTGLTEEKAEKNLPRRGPVNGAQPMPSYPYGSPQWPPATAATAATA